MTGDPRIGTAESGFVQIVAADNDDPQTAFQVPDNRLFRLDRIKIEYEDAATATVDVELYDDADGTAAGNVSDQRDRFPNLDPDSLLEPEGPWRVFEEDVLVRTENGSQDAAVSVTAYGEVLSDLSDMADVA